MIIGKFAAAPILAAGAGLALGLYARIGGIRRYESSHIDVPVPRWPRALEGLKLALVADIHLGHPRKSPWTCPSLTAALEEVRRVQPDLLVLCGDLGFKAWHPEDLASIAGLFEAPNRVAVMGNHDYALGESSAGALRESLEREGFSVLVNEVKELCLRGETLWIAGLGDSASKHDDIQGLISALPEGAHPAILLSHGPDAVESAPAGIFDVALSGHTHGGQVALPFVQKLILLRLARTSYNRGLYFVNGMPLFVTKGLGMVGYHARFRARPEVAFLTLKTNSGST